MKPRAAETGFLLVGLVTMMTVFGIMSGVAVQQWSVIEQREREAQLMFIQEQYASAILAYQKANGGNLPAKLEQLDEKGEGNQRFIRRLYLDPMLRGKGEITPEDWCLLQVAPGGQVRSSCAQEGQAGLLNADGSQFRLGQASQTQTGQQQGAGNQAAAAGGAAGIAGVHSRSSEKAFNMLKREGGTYDSWYYTFEDWQNEMNSRGYPGLANPQGQAPGAPGGGIGQQQPGSQRPTQPQNQQPNTGQGPGPGGRQN